jgi:hypothetical protein
MFLMSSDDSGRQVYVHGFTRAIHLLYSDDSNIEEMGGDCDIEDTPIKLSEETFGNKTFND